MNFYIQLITIVIPIIIQQTTQHPVMRYDGKTSLSLEPRHLQPFRTEFQHIPLSKQKLLNDTNKKKLADKNKLADDMITVNEMPIESNTNKKLGSNTKNKLGSNTIKKLTERTDDQVYIKFDDNRIDNVIKYDGKDKRAEYDAYGKRYYRIPMEDDGNGVKYDMYEDDSGTRYYKVYVIDDRAGYVVINGVRYYRTSRPANKQSKKSKVPLNQQIYSNTIQNFDQNNVFNKLSSKKLSKIVKSRNKFHFRY